MSKEEWINKYWRLLFPYANESIDAVVQGMDINEEEEVIAICGSGDVVFGMLEKARSVVGVDINPLQVDYALERKVLLKEGYLENFLNIGKVSHARDTVRMKQSIDYFSQPGRIERIRGNLERLTIKQGDILKRIDDAAKAGKRFTKAYLSNILTWNFVPLARDPELAAKEREEAQKYGEKYATRVIELLDRPAIIYVAIGCSVIGLNLDAYKDIFCRDIKLTEIAKEKERNWEPLVYRRADNDVVKLKDKLPLALEASQ
ncbi:MAG: hypothetical protein V1734_06165 [Nanoarchaeota archaeon]